MRRRNRAPPTPVLHTATCYVTTTTQFYRNEISTFSPPQTRSAGSIVPSSHHSLLVANMPMVIGEKLSLLLPPPQNWSKSAITLAELPIPCHALRGRYTLPSMLKLMKFTVVLGLVVR